jgi:hypothetical protein
MDDARPSALMDPAVDDVVGALQERLFCMGVGRDDLIVADPFMKRAPWRTRVSPALLKHVSKMFIIRGGRWRSPAQAEMEEFRTIRARRRARTAQRAHQVGVALASLPWARQHPSLLPKVISWLSALPYYSSQLGQDQHCYCVLHGCKGVTPTVFGMIEHALNHLEEDADKMASKPDGSPQ